MSDREQFLVWVQSEFVRAERAMYDGDDGPRRAAWSEHEPVSVLGAWRNAADRAELVEAFEELAASFSNCTDYAFDLIAFDVQGDMAYTVGYERISTSVNGQPRTFTLRATQVYRREQGGWRVVHRHADTVG
ncbi:nuclear transport factor 2 family protein [Agromyces sp. NPDC058110]|uniref:nuclear transport factor 2 family protein n=1 Tax=Agromyces sp. NPDC058110 TaxID=3346345 RepID=UPI0036DA8E41